MKRVSAGVAIKEGTVLIPRRKPIEKLAGFGKFSGGKVEEGETPQECLERELYEELVVKAGMRVSRIYSIFNLKVVSRCIKNSYESH